MNSIIKIIILVLAMLLVSYVVVPFVVVRQTEAAEVNAVPPPTLADVDALKRLFGTSRAKIFKNKTIAIYTAVSGYVATCVIWTAGKSLATLNQDGWYLADFNSIELPEQTEKGCYDRAAAY